jgi:spore maturation protein CgeB
MLGTDSPIKRHLDYKKFAEPNSRIVLLDTPYPAVRESGRALEKLGHTVFPITLGNDFIKRLLTLLVKVKPDFICTVNHIGFDESGALAHLLTELRMPFASWYVDNPRYILKDTANTSPFCSVFCWERAYLPHLEHMGFHAPEYLPLATDPDIFATGGTGTPGYSASVSFVGDSMVAARSKWEKRVPEALLEKLSGWTCKRRQADRSKAMGDLLRETGMSEADCSLLDMEAALAWKLTQDYRKSLVSGLLPLGLVIYGDEGWKEVLPGCGSVRPSVNYYSELPSVYRGSVINVNATSFQMPTAVNQRVFDVPACGGFLLTDHQEDMDRFFEPGRESVCYETPEEAVELAAYYRKNETERLKIAHAARERTLAEHTYEARMSALVRSIRKKYS